ncbi:MAG: NAD(+) synthase, partial [Winogradskyella sp.]|nr:NAD(+) synthase [Winogradskyella sp.]
MQTEKVVKYIVDWLKDYALNAKMKGFVVGVS